MDKLWLFLFTSFLLTIAPGPDIVFVLSQGITRGRKAGLSTAAGLAAGNLVHTSAVALGIAALLAASPTAFTILKFAGVVYLLFLAWKTFLHRKDRLETQEGLPSSRLFWRGFVMNILNPKVIMFFLAFFPQFIPPDTPDPVKRTFLLGGIFIAVVLAVFSTIGLLAGSVGVLLAKYPGIGIIMNWINIAVFSGLAARLLF